MCSIWDVFQQMRVFAEVKNLHRKMVRIGCGELFEVFGFQTSRIQNPKILPTPWNPSPNIPVRVFSEDIPVFEKNTLYLYVYLYPGSPRLWKLTVPWIC